MGPLGGVASLSPFSMAPFAVVPFLVLTAANGLEWLTGCHTLTTPRGVNIQENWTSTEGGLMLGVNRTIRNGKAVAFEFLRIDSEHTYIAMPGGKNETHFRLASKSDTEVIFANPEHDFPKRIIYRKTAEGLTARVDAGEGSTKAQEFPFKSVPCQAAKQP
ncbi:hypothetical protein F183_A51710 [Bryobacterales bacterium F-183]|nr:hypothetical protein F183_A51710 [Bryobacterales bacterium F-183]